MIEIQINTVKPPISDHPKCRVYVTWLFSGGGRFKNLDHIGSKVGLTSIHVSCHLEILVSCTACTQECDRLYYGT